MILITIIGDGTNFMHCFGWCETLSKHRLNRLISPIFRVASSYGLGLHRRH